MPASITPPTASIPQISQRPGSGAKRPTPLTVWVAMIIIYIVWGSTYLAIRFAVETMPPFLMAATRFLVAGSILYLWRRWKGDAAPTRREWRSAAIIGGFLLVGGNGFLVWAEQRVFSGIASLIIASVPLWIVVLDSLFFRSARKRYSWVTVVGVLVGFAGIVLLLGPSELAGLVGRTNPTGLSPVGVSSPVSGSGSTETPCPVCGASATAEQSSAGEASSAGGVDPIGGLVLLAGSLLWSAGSIYARGAKLPSSALLGTGMEMLAGGAGLLALATLAGEWKRLNFSGFAPHSIWGLVYLILFGSLLGFTAYLWLLRNAPTALVSTYAYVNPLVAIFVGNLLASEPLTPRVLAAAAIILGAVVIITLTQRPVPADPRPTTAPEDQPAA